MKIFMNIKDGIAVNLSFKNGYKKRLANYLKENRALVFVKYGLFDIEDNSISYIFSEEGEHDKIEIVGSKGMLVLTELHFDYVY